MLTDTHCHLYREFYPNIDEVIKSAEENGVNRFISSADSLSSCYEMLELTSKYNNVYVTLGIHPENCFDDVSKLEELIKENISNKKVIAVGEIGLDYYYGKENKEQQIIILEEQLKIAQKYNLPVVIHSREATLDTINILKKYHVRGVIHCFSGSLETAKEYIKMGYLIGVGGVITFKNAKLKEVIQNLKPENILLETDSPFLSPEPFRGKTNEPKNIKIIAEYLANLWHIDLSEIEKKTNQNIKDIFDI